MHPTNFFQDNSYVEVTGEYLPRERIHPYPIIEEVPNTMRTILSTKKREIPTTTSISTYLFQKKEEKIYYCNKNNK
jgi:hypothetical protein